MIMWHGIRRRGPRPRQWTFWRFDSGIMYARFEGKEINRKYNKANSCLRFIRPFENSQNCLLLDLYMTDQCVKLLRKKDVPRWALKAVENYDRTGTLLHKQPVSSNIEI